MKKLIALAGPSAVGKTTLASYMREGGMPVELVRSATTRAPRADGNDAEYIYLDREAFIAARESGGMLESTEYEGNLYGTPRDEIERIFDEGKIPLLILDLEGIKSIGESAYDSLRVYLFDSIATLEERLYARYLGKDPSAEGIVQFAKRKNRNLFELANIERSALLVDVIVSNASLEDAFKKIAHAYECGTDEKEREEGVAEVVRMLLDHRNRMAPMPPPPPPPMMMR